MSQIEEALQSAKDVLGNEDADAATLSAAAEKLQSASHAMAAAMYGSASPEGEAADPHSAPADDEEEVLEAEVVEDDGESS